jgi:hypothetical protein
VTVAVSLAIDFEAAVAAPFRMQPGLRRLAPGAPHLTPLAPGSRHQREKLAVLAAFAGDALQRAPGWAPERERAALAAVAAQAAAEHPAHWRWDAGSATAWSPAQGVGVRQADGAVHDLAPGRFGLGDEVGRVLRDLPADWRLAGLLALSFAEDLALLDGGDGSVPWMAVALPSHWAPADKIGRHFAAIHAPVADAALLQRAAGALVQAATAGERWERFVWNVSPHPRLHAHPARVAPAGWAAHRGDRPEHRRTDLLADLRTDDAAAPAPDASPPPPREAGNAADFDPGRAWWRSERQTLLPLATVPAHAGEPALAGLSLFTIGVQVQPLPAALAAPGRAQRLHDALASMSPAVLAYRGLTAVREPLLAWLQAQAALAAQAAQAAQAEQAERGGRPGPDAAGPA